MASIRSRYHQIRRVPLAACLITTVGFAGIYHPLTANTLAVTDCTDGVSSTTLRQVVASAVSGDIINATACVNSTITLGGTEIPINVSNLTIYGPSNDSLIIDASHVSRVFSHSTGGGTLTLEHLAIVNGQMSGTGIVYGGCIYSKGSVHLDHVVVSGCQVLAANNFGNARGGGVNAQGTLTMDYSTISGNEALSSGTLGYAYGGGVLGLSGLTCRNSTITGNKATNVAAVPPSAGGGLFSRYTVLVQSSTIDSNQAGHGGGMYIQNGTLTVTNSTISSNTADTQGGGGIYLASSSTTANIYNTTVAFNSAAQSCAGICSYGNLTLQSTIAANNAVTGAGNADLFSTNSVGGAFNLIVDANQKPTGTIAFDPQLGPLANHGGLTRTHSINATSPALDAGSNAYLPSLSFDQRGSGFARNVGSAPDIGAYERQTVDDEIFFGGFQ